MWIESRQTATMSNPTHIIEFDVTLIVCSTLKYHKKFWKEDIKQETFWNKQQSIS